MLVHTTQRTARAASIAAASLFLFGALVLPTPPAAAATGDLVAQVTFSIDCASGLGVGIAFDGTNLWYTCYATPTDLYKANPTTGAVVASFNVLGGLGAIAWDAGRGQLWAGAGCAAGQTGSEVYLINPTTGVATLQFNVPSFTGGCLDDGLAYDGLTDTIYHSWDGATTIRHLSTAGVPQGDDNFAWGGSGCYNSGLAIGGSLLYQGSDGCNHVWVVDKVSKAASFDFNTAVSGDPNFRDEDLECDPVTFASSGRSVMWSKEAYSPMRAAAFEIPAGTCGLGGGGSGAPEDASCTAIGLLVQEKDQTGPGALGNLRNAYAESDATTTAVDGTPISPPSPPMALPPSSPGSNSNAQLVGVNYANALLGIAVSSSTVYSECHVAARVSNNATTAQAYGRAGAQDLAVTLPAGLFVGAKLLEFAENAYSDPTASFVNRECHIVRVDGPTPPPPPLLDVCPAANTVLVNQAVGPATVIVTLNEQNPPVTDAATGTIVYTGAALHVQVTVAGVTDVNVYVGYVSVDVHAPAGPPPQDCDTPGPDADGYRCFGVPFAFDNISATGIPLALGDDQVSAAVPLGFAFPFYGTVYTVAYVSSNGFVTFNNDPNSGCCAGQFLPDPASPNNLVAGYWTDLYPPGGGSITYQTLGIAPNREFVAQWTNVPHYPGNTPVTFQIALFEGSTRIEVRLANAVSDGSHVHVTGIEDATGSIGLRYKYGDYSAVNTAVRFTT